MMGRSKDRFWDYAKRLDGRFECFFCGRVFAGGIPRVKSHLSGIRGRDIDICTKVPKDVQIAAGVAINGPGPNKKLKAIPSSGDEDDVSAEIKKRRDSSIVDDLLAKLVLVYGLDVGALQDGSLLDFVDAFTSYGPGYKIPSEPIFRTKLVPSLTTKVEEYVTNVKKSWHKSGCTLISGIRHDAKGKSFATITACSPEGAVFLCSPEIPRDDLTSSFLQDLASSVIQRLGPENVVQYMSGCSENELPSKSIQVGEYHVLRTQCAAKELQFLFEDICHEVEWFREIIKKAGVLSLMRQYTNSQELKEPAVNDISSNFDMLRSLVKVKKELLLLVSSSEWIDSVNGNDETYKKVTEIIKDEEFWDEGEKILQNFESLLQVVRLVNSEGLNFGYLYGAMETAEATLTRLCNLHLEKYKRIREMFVERRGNMVHPVHAAAAFLNPAYMCSEKFEEDSKIKAGTDFLLEKLVKVEEREDFNRQMLRYRKKPPDLFNCTALTMLKTSHPYEWWDYCGDSVPILKKYASKILSQPCSASSIKGCMRRLETVQTMAQWRSRPARIEKYMYLRTNALHMEKFSSMKAQVMKPVDLDNLDKLPTCTFSEDYFLDLIDQSVKLDPMSELKVSWSTSTEKSASQGKCLQLQFKTDISYHVVVKDMVTGELGASIRIVLVDSETGNIVQAGPESMMKLSIVVLDGGFDPEARGNWTHAEFDDRVIVTSDGGRRPLTGDLEVILNQGVGTVGALTFHAKSYWTTIGKFRLGVKATTGDRPGIQIREGISNAFKVEERDHGNDLSIGLGSETNNAISKGIEPVPPIPAVDTPHDLVNMSPRCQTESMNQVVGDGLTFIQAQPNSCASRTSSSTPAMSPPISSRGNEGERDLLLRLSDFPVRSPSENGVYKYSTSVDSHDFQLW